MKTQKITTREILTALLILAAFYAVAYLTGLILTGKHYDAYVCLKEEALVVLLLIGPSILILLLGGLFRPKRKRPNRKHPNLDFEVDEKAYRKIMKEK